MELDAFEILNFDSQNTLQICKICNFNFKNGDLVSKLPCHHIFHETCLKAFLKTKTFCPECQFELAEIIRRRESRKDLQRRQDLRRRRRRSRMRSRSRSKVEIRKVHTSGSPSRQKQLQYIDVSVLGRMSRSTEPEPRFTDLSWSEDHT